ncbi:MAG: hypothetical protein U9N51_05835 [Bacteroidota bacterium]|nr:hypothetical protein [Bacteroidota bacterium]
MFWQSKLRSFEGEKEKEAIFLTQNLDFPSRIPALSETLRRNPSHLRFFQSNDNRFPFPIE